MFQAAYYLYIETALNTCVCHKLLITCTLKPLCIYLCIFQAAYYLYIVTTLYILVYAQAAYYLYIETALYILVYAPSCLLPVH